MDDKKQFSRRLLAIGVLFSLVLAAYFVTLFDAQIVHGAEYRARSIRANTKSETVVTSRGILTDRNGKALVTNRSVYTLELDTSLAPSDDAALNKELLRLIELLESRGIVWEDTLPLTAEQNEKLAAAGADVDEAVFAITTDDVRDVSLKVHAGEVVALAGLVGAWLGVHVGKLITGYKPSTGDLFAPAVALAMLIGRFGCLLTELPGQPPLAA